MGLVAGGRPRFNGAALPVNRARAYSRLLVDALHDCVEVHGVDYIQRILVARLKPIQHLGMGS